VRKAEGERTGKARAWKKVRRQKERDESGKEGGSLCLSVTLSAGGQTKKHNGEKMNGERERDRERDHRCGGKYTQQEQNCVA